jgi:predicted transcriptional regulator
MKHTTKLMLLVLLFTSACSPLMSNFDQVSYQQATSLKVDALNLMDEGTTDYAGHIAEVKDLQIKIDKAIEYDKHRSHNEITNQMWAILNDPQKNLLGGFLVKWLHDGKCSTVYITEKKKQISFSFDQIAELESKKIKTAQTNN